MRHFIVLLSTFITATAQNQTDASSTFSSSAVPAATPAFVAPVVLPASAASAALAACPAEGEFRCHSSGRCIPVHWLCDGARDCEGGEDESEHRCHPHEHTRCAGDQPECRMHDGGWRCILHEWLCDGHADCADESDEKDCETKPPNLPSHLLESSKSLNDGSICSPSEFRCGSGSCISRDLLCDDTPNCPDASDESEDRCSTPPRIPHPEPVHEDVDDATFNMGVNTTSVSSNDTHFDDVMSSSSTSLGGDEMPTPNSSSSSSSSSSSYSSGLSSLVNEFLPDNNPPFQAPSSNESKLPALNTILSVTSAVPEAFHEPDAAFQHQIEKIDGPNDTAQSSSSLHSQIEDRNQAPPDPFPFDLANYEIPEADEVGHDEIGPGEGLNNGATTSTPRSGAEKASESRREEVPLPDVLRFMKNETTRLLKTINATRGQAVKSYKTMMNKSEVLSLSSYKNKPGLYARLSPFEEIFNKNSTDLMEKPRSRERGRRHTVKFRAVSFESDSSEQIRKRKASEIDKKEEKSANKSESTPAPIVPFLPDPVAVQKIAPIVPENKEKSTESKPSPPKLQPDSKQPENLGAPKSDVKETKPNGATSRTRPTTTSPPSIGTKSRLPAEPDPKPKSTSTRPARSTPEAAFARSERLIEEGEAEKVLRDESPTERSGKRIPQRIDRALYKDDGEGSMD